MICETNERPTRAQFAGGPSNFEHESVPNQPDLQTVLEAWHDAAIRLEHTHATLQAEVARLTDELERKNRELARKNRLADLGRVSSHVAHEVRNSLVPVTLYLSVLRRRLAADADSLEVLTKIEAGFTTLDATVNDLLSFAAHRQPQWQGFLVCSLVDEICESLAPQFDAQRVDLEVDVPPNVVLHADREMVRRAVLNLVLNSLDAMPRGGNLVITCYEGSRGLELEIADTGPGLSSEAKRRVFDPFYSTKESGTGLGLSVVYHVAEAHGGTISAANCPEGGAAFTLRIPRRRALGVAA
jgi:signal transduction histidine kinase